MINIGRDQKILLFDVSTDGIGFSDLEFWFRIYNEDVVFSFRGELLDEDNKVKVTIPPMTRMINKEYLDFDKSYKANLEVIGEGKYFINTWEGEIQLESNPCIDIKLVSETTQTTKSERQRVQTESIGKVVSKKIIDKKKIEKVPIEEETVIEEEKETIKNIVENRKVKKYSSSLLEEILEGDVGDTDEGNILDELK